MARGVAVKEFWTPTDMGGIRLRPVDLADIFAQGMNIGLVAPRNQLVIPPAEKPNYKIYAPPPLPSPRRHRLGLYPGLK